VNDFDCAKKEKVDVAEKKFSTTYRIKGKEGGNLLLGHKKRGTGRSITVWKWFLRHGARKKGEGEKKEEAIRCDEKRKKRIITGRNLLDLFQRGGEEAAGWCYLIRTVGEREVREHVRCMRGFLSTEKEKRKKEIAIVVSSVI